MDVVWVKEKIMENEDYVKSDREKRLTPQAGHFWCYRCDRNLVSPHKKCPTCGAKPIRKSIRKETSS